MKRRLILRFVLTFVLITLCMQLLSGGAWVLLHHLLFPNTGILGKLVSVITLFVGAVLFAQDPAQDYHNLCEKVYRLAKETDWAQEDSVDEPDVDRDVDQWLDTIASRITSKEEALRVRRNECEEAALQLNAASAQIAVLVEAGTFADESGELKLAEDALEKIKQASAKIY